MKNIFKYITAFLLPSLFLPLSNPSYPIKANGDAIASVTIESNATVTKGSNYYAYVYISSLENIASLNISVHFNEEVLSINNTYNNVSCSLYDNSLNADYINYSYIFDVANNPSSKTSLFYFSYKIKEDTSISTSYFDVIIDEAIDSSLNDIDVDGSIFNFSIKDKETITKYCYVYSNGNISSKIEEEFELYYYFSTNQIASGSIQIIYDQELFEYVSLSKLGFFENKILDINASVKGVIYISFVGTSYSSTSELFKVKFKTIANKDISSSISFAASELYDLTLSPLKCNGYKSNINLSYDEQYDDSIARMSLSSSLDESNDILTLNINLSSSSFLGAGDFLLNFDVSHFTYLSSEKKFTPSFFNINDKEVGEGKLKFSIISLSDITEAVHVLEIKFNVLYTHDDIDIPFTISGSGLADSLTNPIKMNFVSLNQFVKGECKFSSWSEYKPATCFEEGSEKRYCLICNKEEYRAITMLDASKLFVDMINDIDIDNDSSSSLSNKLAVATKYYSFIDNKEDISSSYSLYTQYISLLKAKYNTNIVLLDVNDFDKLSLSYKSDKLSISFKGNIDEEKLTISSSILFDCSYGASLSNILFIFNDGTASNLSTDNSSSGTYIGSFNEGSYISDVTSTNVLLSASKEAYIRKMVIVIKDDGVNTWMDEFISLTNNACLNPNSDNYNALKDIWDDLEKDYLALSDEAKKAIKDISLNEDSSYSLAMKRYEHIVNRYKLNDFIGRDISINNSNGIFNLKSDADALFIIFPISFAFLSVLGICFMVRRRKEN